MHPGEYLLDESAGPIEVGRGRRRPSGPEKIVVGQEAIVIGRQTTGHGEVAEVMRREEIRWVER